MRRRDFSLGNSNGGPEAILVAAFCDRLAELGFVKNCISVKEYRWSQGLPQQLEPFVLDSIWKGAKPVEAPGNCHFVLDPVRQNTFVWCERHRCSPALTR